MSTHLKLLAVTSILATGFGSVSAYDFTDDGIEDAAQWHPRSTTFIVHPSKGEPCPPNMDYRLPTDCEFLFQIDDGEIS